MESVQQCAAEAQDRQSAGRVRWFALAVFLVAVCIRMLYLLESTRNPTFYVPIVDSSGYDLIARNLVSGSSMSEKFFWQPPLYPLFLSLIYLLSNSSILAAKLVQLIVGCFTAMLAYRLGARLFGAGAGLAAGIITAVYMPLVFLEGELLAAGWAAFWSVSLVLLFLKVTDKPTAPSCIVLGSCGALSITTRPEFLPFFAAGCLWLAVRALREKTFFSSFAPKFAMVFAGFLLPAIPIAMAGYRATGRVTILPVAGGINFYIGNNPNYSQTIVIRPGAEWRKLFELPLKEGVRDLRKQDEWFLKKTKQYIIHHPFSFAAGLCRKTLQFLSSREIPRNLDVYLFRKWSPLLTVGVWKTGRFGFPFGLLLPLAVCGVIYCCRKVPAPVWLYLFFYPAAVILVFVTSRYRTPAVPVIAVLAGGGCIAIKTAIESKQWRQLLAVGAVCLACAAIAMPPTAPEETLNYEPELYYGLGQSFEKQGRTEEAIAAYSKAISLKPDYLEAHSFLGNLYFRLDRLDLAEKHYRRAVEAAPSDAIAISNLALCLKKQGRIDEAIKYYQMAILVDPQYVPALQALREASAEKR